MREERRQNRVERREGIRERRKKKKIAERGKRVEDTFGSRRPLLYCGAA